MKRFLWIPLIGLMLWSWLGAIDPIYYNERDMLRQIGFNLTVDSTTVTLDSTETDTFDVTFQYSTLPILSGASTGRWASMKSGFFTLWVTPDSLKTGDPTDSLTLSFHEMDNAGTVPSASATSIVSNLDWDDGDVYVYKIMPRACFGIKFYITHTGDGSTADSMSVMIKLISQ